MEDLGSNPNWMSVGCFSRTFSFVFSILGLFSGRHIFGQIDVVWKCLVLKPEEDFLPKDAISARSKEDNNYTVGCLYTIVRRDGIRGSAERQKERTRVNTSIS